MKQKRKQAAKIRVSTQGSPEKSFLARNDLTLLAFFIAIITFAVYIPSLQNGFLTNWDDNRYVLENKHIRSLGFTFFKWAFIDYKTNLWHPLTWISHALDYALWGMEPFGHHLTNVVLHAVNAAIVVILSSVLLTGITIPGNPEGCDISRERRYLLAASGITGLLFGIHPLHVESVAWVTERKDLLYSLFYMLSMISYIRYVGRIDREAPRLFLGDRSYLLSVGLFILSLLSKPMAVTLPAILLLLDWYPLRRIQAGRWRSLLAEKIPFLVFSLLGSLLAIIAQKGMGAMKSLTEASLVFRVMLACKSLVLYLAKILLPVGLLPLYPYPAEVIPYRPEYLVGLVLVLSLTALCVVFHKDMPYFAAVWFFFVISLLPVLGIMQAGIQSMADRFAYLATFGPLLLAGVGAVYLWRMVLPFPVVRTVSVSAGIAAVALLLYLTVQQIAIWKDAVTLWSYMIDKYSGKYAEGFNYRGQAFHKAGLLDSAIEDFTRCIVLDPKHDQAHVNRGMCLFAKGLLDRAIDDFDKAIELNPNEDIAYTNRGYAYAQKGAFSKAKEDYTKAISIKPFYVAYFNRGLVYMDEGDLTLAAKDLDAAVSLQPDDPQVYPVRGDLYMKMGRIDLALEDYTRACTMGVQVACEKVALPFQKVK